MATTAPSPDLAPAPAPPITRIHRLSFGFGAVANGVKNAAFSTYLLLFYNQVLGVPAAIVSGAIALTLLVDAFADPFIGRWSDMTRSRIGRRHPFIFGSALPTAAFFVLSWFPPAGLSDMQMGFWIFALAALTRMSISAFEIPTSAMAAELTDNYSERTGLFGLRYFFGYLGTFGFAAFSLAVFFVATPEISRGQLNPEGYVKFAWLGGALIFIAILVCGWGTLSRVPYLRQRDEPGEGATPASHFKEMWQAFRNRGFLAIFGFGVFKYTAIGLYAATTVYFSTYVFKLKADQLALLTFDSLIAAVLAAPLAPRFSRWLGKRNTSMLMAIFGIALGISPLLLTLLDSFFLPGDPRLLPTLFVIGAVYGAMIAISLINTLQALDVDIETRRPMLRNLLGGLSGPAIRPVALRMVWQASRAVAIPICGMGGITSAEDAVKFLLCGASAVQVGTANYIDPRSAEAIVEGLAEYAARHGVARIADLVGALEPFGA